ncbi:MAG: hypothetical protein HKO57_04515 [Akkermansiaceae bacterium]|nr:hypothetical protein [Akkermansiaceae bacterium]
MTHDAVHPNTEGETYVGDRIAAGLGLIATPLDTTPPSAPPTEKETLDTCYEGNEIWTVIFMNGWNELNGTGAVKTLSGDLTDLRYDHSGSGLATMLDGTATGWDAGNDGDWTIETRLNFLANPSGFMLWLGTGTRRILVEIHADRTQDFGADEFNVAHNNLDGQFHVYRVAHDSIAGVYHVWRDGDRLTPVDGAPYDQTGPDSRLLMGDFTGGPFGDDFVVDIDYVCYDLSGAYLPPGADADGDGMPDEWEHRNFGTITGGDPAGDHDGDGNSNLDEYHADTDPWDPESSFRVSSISEDGQTVSVTVADTSRERQYTLHESDDLGVTDPWTAVAGPVPGNGGDLVMEDPGPIGEKRFYVVEAGLP